MLAEASDKNAIHDGQTDWPSAAGDFPAAQADTGYEADVLVTVHPSFLLRVPDEDRHAAYERFVADLKLIRPYAS